MSRHPKRLRRQPLPFQATWDYLCGRSPSPPVPWTSGNLAQDTPPAAQKDAIEHIIEKPVVSTSAQIISSNLTTFWAGFNPDLPDLEDPPVPLLHLTTCGLNSDFVRRHGVRTNGKPLLVPLALYRMVHPSPRRKATLPQ